MYLLECLNKNGDYFLELYECNKKARYDLHISGLINQLLKQVMP